MGLHAWSGDSFWDAVCACWVLGSLPTSARPQGSDGSWSGHSFVKAGMWETQLKAPSCRTSPSASFACGRIWSNLLMKAQRTTRAALQETGACVFAFLT